MPDFTFEDLHGRGDGKLICGIDEVGRGPLAGPVVAAALILPVKLPRGMKSAIRDSKQMTHEEREALYAPLTEIAVSCVAEASVAEIDSLNILWASMLAMQRAAEGLLQKLNGALIDMALIDGNRCPRLDCAATAIIGGDDKCLSIAAASIVAKVTRDRRMAALHSDHPHYGWNSNAGYGTPHHKRALKEHGPTVWHRRSFAPVREAERTFADMQSRAIP